MDRDQIKNTAVEMAKESGLINLSRLALCKRVGIPDGSFPHVMGCNFSELVEELKKEVPEDSSYIVSKGRTNPALRKASILDAAVEVSKTHGYSKVTRDQVADEAGVSVGLVTRYFTMTQIKRAVMRAAVKRGIPEIIAQGLVNRDPHASKASEELKAQAATHIANL